MERSLAAAITQAASRQTHFTIRLLVDRPLMADAYPIVTHAFNFVGRGALGMFQAGDGGPAVQGGH